MDPNKGIETVLQLVFGLTYTNLNVYLQFGIRLIVEIFWSDPLARVSLPSVDEIALYMSAFSERHPLLIDCWARMDGLKLHLQASGNLDIQERYYNWWTHNHYVNSVFCFYPDGTIPIAFFNVPGSVHDSQVAEIGKIYQKLEKVYNQTGGKCCVDLAFGKMDRQYLYQSCQDMLGSSAPTHAERMTELRKKREATSAKQTAEWGMLTMQASFPRIRDRFVYKEHGERRIVLKMFVLLYNMRARMVGLTSRLEIHICHTFYEMPMRMCSFKTYFSFNT
jgi:hypothetical protein